VNNLRLGFQLEHALRAKQRIEPADVACPRLPVVPSRLCHDLNLNPLDAEHEHDARIHVPEVPAFVLRHIRQQQSEKCAHLRRILCVRFLISDSFG